MKHTLLLLAFFSPLLIGDSIKPTFTPPNDLLFDAPKENQVPEFTSGPEFSGPRMTAPLKPPSFEEFCKTFSFLKECQKDAQK